ncbi:MAG TPA: DnaJ C-terminal domain-containing protein [Woeseiaceae bacterium]|nr:DnaJ C-terminal domain-containing protein [Woeseiaceae bacterium]
MQFKDYYETLGVKRDANADDIKRAYRRLARKYHPDVSKETDAETRFKEMKEAYEVLKDPEKRSAYDSYGANWKAGQEYQPPGGGHGYSSTGADFDGAHDFSDFFESMFGARNARGGFGAGRGSAHMDGGDLNARIVISVEDAYAGATRQISLAIPEVDEDGVIRNRQRTLKVRIPKGIGTGQRIRLESQGAPGIGSKARRGDLYLEVQIEDHPIYQLDGRDVHVKLPIADWEAALGASVKVPTLGGTVDLKVPGGSSSGKRLRLKGRGMPGNPAGDQYVELQIKVPARLSKEARSLYEKLKAEQLTATSNKAGA